MQTKIHTDLQLTAATLHDKQLMLLITHLALESPAPTTFDLCEFLPATMLTLVSVAKLLLHCGNATLTLRRLEIWRCDSVNNLLGTSDKILLNPEITAASSWIGPFSTTFVAELRAASTSIS